MSSLRSIVAALIAGTTLAVSMPAMAQSSDNAYFDDPQPTVTYGNRRNVNNSKPENSTIRNGKVTTQPVTQPSTSGNPVRKRPPEDSVTKNHVCINDGGPQDCRQECRNGRNGDGIRVRSCADSQPPTNKDTRNTGTVRIRR